MNNYNYQKGATLIITLFFLLVMTVLGVSAVSVSVNQTQTAGNNIFTMFVYQGAESTLSKVGDFYHVKDVSTTTPLAITNLPDESIGEASLKSSALISYKKLGDCPVFSEVTSNTVTCKFFQIDAQTRIDAVNARTTHVEGLAVTAP